MQKKKVLFKSFLRAFIEWYKSVLLEIRFKNFIGRKMRFELFELHWGFNYYILPFKRKFKNLQNKILSLFIKTKTITNEKNQETNLMITNFFHKKNLKESVVITFGNAVIYSEVTPIYYDIGRYLIKPLVYHDILNHYVADINSLVYQDHRKEWGDYAFDFFSNWGWFTKKLVDEDNEVYYDTMFPLNPTEDYFFDRGLKRLEKKYGTKIISFLAINMLERYYIPDSANPIPNGSVCDLQYLFRHKDSLGWFIALLQTAKKTFLSANNVTCSFNVNNIIENLSYIYDILGKEKSYTKIKSPKITILATMVFSPLLTYPGMTLYAHTKLLMFEVLGTIPNSTNIWDISKIFNAARIIHAKSFYEGLPLKSIPPNATHISDIIEFNIELVDKYDAIYYNISPENQNLNANPSNNFLLKQVENSGKRFNYPVASTGMTQHFDGYIMKSPKTINGFYFDYSIVNNASNNIETNIPIMINEYYKSTAESLIITYENIAKTTNVTDFKLFIDYAKTQKDFIPEATKEKMHLLNLELAKKGFGDKVIIVNSSDMENLMNQAIWEHSKESVLSRSERNSKFFSLLRDPEKNKLSSPKDAHRSHDLQHTAASFGKYIKTGDFVDPKTLEMLEKKTKK